MKLEAEFKVGHIYYHPNDDVLLVLEALNNDGTLYLTAHISRRCELAYRIHALNPGTDELFYVGKL